MKGPLLLWLMLQAGLMMGGTVDARDRIVTRDGAVLTGHLRSVSETAAEIETVYAGRLRIERTHIKALATADQRVWTLRSGEEIVARARLDDTAGWILIRDNFQRVVPLDKVQRLGVVPASPDLAETSPKETEELLKAEADPVQKEASDSHQAVAEKTEEATEDGSFFHRMGGWLPPRVVDLWNWSFEGGFDLNGKSGNSDRFGIGLRANFKAERQQDRFSIFSRYEYGESQGRTNEDEISGGVQYTNFTFEKLGWFVRQELERDRFEGIAFRSTSALGISYRFFDDENFSLESRMGLSYRLEDFLDNGEEGIPGLDLGVEMDWQFAEWGRFRSKWTLLPSLAEQRSFIIEQDSGLNFPLAVSDAWKLRIGLNSQYNNDPGPAREELDNSYYLRLLYSWD